MISLSFVVTLPLFIIAIGVFFYGLTRYNERACEATMSIGLGIGLVGVIAAAVMFAFFSL